METENNTENTREDCDDCPQNYQNRYKQGKQGLVIFGQKIDYLELIGHFALIILLGLPAFRSSMKPDSNWQDSLGWFLAIVGGSTVLRLSPTERIDIYQRIKLK